MRDIDNAVLHSVVVYESKRKRLLVCTCAFMSFCFKVAH